MTPTSASWRDPRPAALLPLLLAGLLLASGSAVHAQSPPTQPALELRDVGWDGIVLSGAWAPIRLRASGGREAVEARVEVVLRVGSDGPGIAYSQELSLPAGATRDLVLWAPIGNSLPGLVRLVGPNVSTPGAGRAVLAEAPIVPGSFRTTTWPLTGVLADATAVEQRVAQALTAGPDAGSARITALRAAEVPPVAERMNALGSLVVQGNAAAALTPEQRLGLRDWVSAGGHLVLAGGLNAPRPAAVLPAGVLPLAPLGVDPSADLSALADWAAAPDAIAGPGPAARYRSAGLPLAGPPERPLAWRFDLGRGTITVLAVDLELEPLASWPGTPALLAKALEPAQPRPGNLDPQRAALRAERTVAQRLASAVDALPAGAYPGWQVVALVLGGFALVVGPLAHGALARADRRGWLWPLVPTAALGCSAVLYAVGIGRDGRDVLGNVVSHVRLDSNGGPARQHLAAGFFAPTHPRLEISVPGETPVRPGGNWDAGNAPSRRTAPSRVPEPVVQVDQAAETRVRFDSNQWVMRTVTLSRSLPGAHGRISADLEHDARALILGTIRNDTPYLLEDPILVLGDSTERLETMAPGDVAQVRVREVPLRRSRGLTQFPPSPSAGTGTPRGAGTPEDRRRARLLAAVLEPERTGPGPVADVIVPLTLFAFVREPIGADFPHVGGRPAYHLTLIEQRLAVKP